MIRFNLLLIFFKTSSLVVAQPKTVHIGEQVWMSENLNVDKFRNGDPIPEAKTDEEWIKASENMQPAWCYYENNSVNGEKYGKLYNWYAVNDARGLAPYGWHIPYTKEWQKLLSTATSELKSTHDWNAYFGQNSNGTNETGYCALPSGGRNQFGKIEGGYNLGFYTSWWANKYTDMECGTKNATYFSIAYNNSSLTKDCKNKGNGFSVRCVSGEISSSENENFRAEKDKYSEEKTSGVSQENKILKNGWCISTSDYLNGEKTTPYGDFVLCGKDKINSRYFSRKEQKWINKYPICGPYSIDQISWNLRNNRTKYYNALMDEDYTKIHHYYYFSNEYPERYDKFYFRHTYNQRAIHPHQGYRIYSTNLASMQKDLCPFLQNCDQCNNELNKTSSFTPKLDNLEFKTEKGILTYGITDLGYARIDSTTNVGLYELYNIYTKDLKFRIIKFDNKNVIKNYKIFSLKNEITNIDFEDYNLLYFNRMSKDKLVLLISTTSYQSFTSKDKTFFIGKDKQVHYDWIDISQTVQRANNFMVIYDLVTDNYTVKAFYPSSNNSPLRFYSYSNGLIINFGGDLGIIHYDLNGIATWRLTGSLTDYALIDNDLYAIGYTKDEGYIGYNNTIIYKINMQTGKILNRCIIDYKDLTPDRIFVYDKNLLIVGDRISIYDTPKKFDLKTYKAYPNSTWTISD